jgi:hypothetical protein
MHARLVRIESILSVIVAGRATHQPTCPPARSWPWGFGPILIPGSPPFIDLGAIIHLWIHSRRPVLHLRTPNHVGELQMGVGS